MKDTPVIKSAREDLVVMLSHRQVTEQHLKKAQDTLQERLKELTERKLDKKQVKRDVTYRQVQAVIRKYKRRIEAMDKGEAVIADVAQRRAERLAAPKVPKEKKKKAAPPVKAKGGGSAKKEKKAAAEG